MILKKFAQNVDILLKNNETLDTMLCNLKFQNSEIEWSKINQFGFICFTFNLPHMSEGEREVKSSSSENLSEIL